MNIRDQLDKVSKSNLQIKYAENGNPIIYCNNSFWLECEKDDKAFTEPVMRTGNWEAWVAASITNTLQLEENPLFFDVGANIGYYSVMASQICDVVAFEPNDNIIDITKNNSMYYGKNTVNLFNVAVGSAKYAKLSIPVGHTGGASTTPIGNVQDYIEEENVLTIPMVKLGHLNAVVNYNNYDSFVIKVDVEGNEMDVWNSAEPIIFSKPNIWFIEFVPMRWPLDEVKEFLEKASKTHKIGVVKYDGSIETISIENALQLGFETLVLENRYV